ncbi:MAG: 30S ribosomal protein S4 [Candidatus Omnitrophota bacterium]
MARYREAKCRLCRREEMKLFLKGMRCNTEKCPFTKRPYPPGFHGRARAKKASYYALQLREKQKTKNIYGLLERQFRRFFSIASKSRGATGKVLIQLLERRLDNVIYRALFALSRSQARQLVRHGFVFSGAKRVDIPSYLVASGQTIEIKGNDDVLKSIRGIAEENTKDRSIAGWLTVDNSALKITVSRLPEREDVAMAINEQLIVELYSK